MSGRRTHHLRRQDEGRRSIGREHWSRVIANEIAEGIVNGEIDAADTRDSPSAGDDDEPQPSAPPEVPCGDFASVYGRRFREHHPELGLIVCRGVMPNSLARCPQCREPAIVTLATSTTMVRKAQRRAIRRSGFLGMRNSEVVAADVTVREASDV
jgi:hypothetical protein